MAAFGCSLRHIGRTAQTTLGPPKTERSIFRALRVKGTCPLSKGVLGIWSNAGSKFLCGREKESMQLSVDDISVSHSDIVPRLEPKSIGNENEGVPTFPHLMIL